MPTYPVGIANSINSPYCVRDYRGVNAEFGTLSELSGIVEAAHSKNMAVIFYESTRRRKSIGNSEREK